MNQEWQMIADALRKEVAEYGGLLNLFEEQQRCLFLRDADSVLRLSTEIETHVLHLHEFRRNREAAVAAFAVERQQPPASTLRSLLPHFEAHVRPLIEALISEINVLIHRVRRVSRHNQSLLTRSVEAQQQLLRVLRPDSFTQTYTPNGRMAMSAARPSPALKVAG
ncbi:MAG: flagellar biosynthesis protein FlgN [Opitutus sp.]|nr:flagellar biosynthesis protein FlgN [Opitutus sp.]